jgi:hypothetical protein
LLIGHAVWLRRNDFVNGFVVGADQPEGKVTLAWVDWAQAVRALGAGRLPCSGSEAALLRIAASVAEGIPVDLGEAVTSLDEHNLALVTESLLRAGGSTASVSAAAGVGDWR